MVSERFQAFRALKPRLIFIATVASLGAMGFGFDNSWWGSALGLTPFHKRYGVFDPEKDTWVMPASRISVCTGTGSAGIIIGILPAPWMLENLGRKKTLLVMASYLTIGIILEASAITSFWQFVVGRVIVYAGAGLATNVVTIYQSECAPASVRGVYICLPIYSL